MIVKEVTKSMEKHIQLLKGFNVTQTLIIALRWCKNSSICLKTYWDIVTIDILYLEINAPK
jgi:hypothetical protein